MEDLVQFAWSRLSDLIEAVLKLPLTKLVGGLFAVALLPLIVSALPKEWRQFVKAALIGGCALVVVLELVAPIDWNAVFG